MSRSLVNRGCACSTTATPPTITKSTSAATRRVSSRAGSKSVQLATRPCPREGQDAGLAGHRLEAFEPLRRGELELLADEALVDAGRLRGRAQDELVPQRVERVGNGSDRRVGVPALERGDRRLRRSHAPGELLLGDACLVSERADQAPRLLLLYRIHA